MVFDKNVLSEWDWWWEGIITHKREREKEGVVHEEGRACEGTAEQVLLLIGILLIVSFWRCLLLWSIWVFGLVGAFLFVGFGVGLLGSLLCV